MEHAVPFTQLSLGRFFRKESTDAKSFTQNTLTGCNFTLTWVLSILKIILIWFISVDHLTGVWGREVSWPSFHAALSLLHRTFVMWVSTEPAVIASRRRGEEKENGPLCSHPLPPSSSLFLILRPTFFLLTILQLFISFLGGGGGVSQRETNSTTCKHFPYIFRFLNLHRSPLPVLPPRKSEKRHHIPQPSVSPGKLWGIFSHTVQNALVRAWKTTHFVPLPCSQTGLS